MGTTFTPVIMKVGQYLNFTKIGDTGKTSIIGVGNNSGIKLGHIKWVGAWRKYCYFPAEQTQFDSKCLAEIIKFLDELMMLRKPALNIES
jgi:hypothetical protein